MKLYGIVAAIGLLLISAKAVLSDSGSLPEPIANRAPEEPTPADEYDWLDNLGRATAIAAEHNRPLMVVFR